MSASRWCSVGGGAAARVAPAAQELLHASAVRRGVAPRLRLGVKPRAVELSLDQLPQKPDGGTWRLALCDTAGQGAMTWPRGGAARSGAGLG